jgi:hypothetical protein
MNANPLERRLATLERRLEDILDEIQELRVEVARNRPGMGVGRVEGGVAGRGFRPPMATGRRGGGPDGPVPGRGDGPRGPFGRGFPGSPWDRWDGWDRSDGEEGGRRGPRPLNFGRPRSGGDDEPRAGDGPPRRDPPRDDAAEGC